MIDPHDPLRSIPFRGDYGWRRMRTTSQWQQRYRGLVRHYFKSAYVRRNPFVVTWMEEL
jgi:hypothetical protein